MRSLIAILLYGCALLGAAPTGVDGQWTTEVTDRLGGVVLELKSDGDQLTGWFIRPEGKLEISNGLIHGKDISFEVAATIRDRALVFFCAGQLDGDEIQLTLRAGELGEERVNLKRVDPSAPPTERFSESPAPDEVTTWLKTHAVRLVSAQADSGFADLAPLKLRLQDARVVAMGEATHGTREFQQLKFRTFQFLVEELGFTVFAIESNWPESLSVNEYVLGENIDPEHGLGFDWWRTEDMYAFLRWMREYNRDPEHIRKLKFYGFDMQGPGLAQAKVLDYLRLVDPDAVDAAAEVFGVLDSLPLNKQYEAASAEIKRNTAAGLAALLRCFDEREQEYMLTSSRQDWLLARQNLVIVKQAEVKLGNQNERGKAFRDRAMAENVKWILDQEPPGTKMMLWAHNAHVATAAPLDAPDHLPMGAHLREMFGDRFVSLGFVFGEGSFRAVDMQTMKVREFTLGPPPRGSLDATFAAVGAPLFAIDLRLLPEGVVADWFAQPHISRQIGGGYSDATPGVWMRRSRAATTFDLLMFVDKTTPSRQLR